ncbi:hypothetical protein RND81_14G237000 [Saponaria officinalis]|uniref:Uncharacterized protein n=1 Tax=Saponaria officinalis TaxID=3572 RepID=A0AAW1GT37_SAPOF
MRHSSRPPVSGIFCKFDYAVARRGTTMSPGCTVQLITSSRLNQILNRSEMVAIVLDGFRFRFKVPIFLTILRSNTKRPQYFWDLLYSKHCCFSFKILSFNMTHNFDVTSNGTLVSSVMFGNK